MHVTTVDDERETQLAEEMGRDMAQCIRAFNDSDELSFTDCLEPQITLFAATATLSGRESVVQYFSRSYFHQTPAARLEISESTFHASGDTASYEYEFRVHSKGGVLRGRGVALSRKSDGRWRVVSIHNIAEHFEPGTD
jgi:ketosteroid isomerase-like protein